MSNHQAQVDRGEMAADRTARIRLRACSVGENASFLDLELQIPINSQLRGGSSGFAQF
jgi:hypothetical protein